MSDPVEQASLWQRLSGRITFVIAPMALAAWFVLLWLMFGDVL